IKRKLDGKYVTLAQERVFGRPDEYDRERNPVLLPVGRWLEMRSLVAAEPDGVRIELAIRDPDARSRWRRAGSARDDGADGTPIRDAGSVGLRTDFMDVAFDRLIVREPPDPEVVRAFSGPSPPAAVTAVLSRPRS